MTLDPGAEMSGFILPSVVGPTELKPDKASSTVVEPTPMTLSKSPGELAVLQLGPEFPMEKSVMIPAVRRASVAL